NVLPSSTVIMKSSSSREFIVATSPRLYAVFHWSSNARIFDGALSGFFWAAQKSKAKIANDARTISELLIFIAVAFSRVPSAFATMIIRHYESGLGPRDKGGGSARVPH